MTAQGRQKLPIYKYQGGDDSLIYKYITGKLAQVLVDNVYPETLAPNLITFVGFLIVISPHVALYFIGQSINDFSSGVPEWVALQQAIVMFVYSVLDNSDGKQARKIGASSPLGLMMDHGCDILNTGIATMTMAKVLRIGNGWMFTVVLIATLAQFYFATLEEYFVGGLFLPIVNGVNEGLFLIIGICLLTFFSGSDVWVRDSLIKDLPNNKLVFYLLAVSSIFVLIMNLVNMLKKTDIGSIAQKSLLFFYLTLSTYLALTLVDGLSLYQIWIGYFYIILTARTVNAMQIAHCADEEFLQCYVIPIFLVLCLNILTVAGILAKPISANLLKLLVYLLTSATAVYYTFYVFSVVNILADILNIRVFFVKQKDGLLAGSEPIKS